MCTKEEAIKKIEFFENNMNYYNERIEEANKIILSMKVYFNKYKLNETTEQWEKEVERLEAQREEEWQDRKKYTMILKHIEAIERLENK